MPYHHLSRIDDASILLGIIGGILGGYSSWKTYFVHHYRLREAKILIHKISQTVNALTADDKAAIDTYIAQVAASNPQHTECLLDTQRMLDRLAEAQRQHAEVNETLAASPRLNFPWSDVAHSIKALLAQCIQLHMSVSQTTAQGLEHRNQSSTPTISSFIQQSPAASSFIQDPPHSYAGSHHTRGPYGHSTASGLTSFSGYSGGGHPVGAPNCTYPPNPSSSHILPSGSQSSGWSTALIQPAHPAYAGQSMAPSNNVSPTSGYVASTASQGQSLQTYQSGAPYGSQYSVSSGTSGYVTAPSTYTTASSSASHAASGSSSSSAQWSANAPSGSR